MRHTELTDLHRLLASVEDTREVVVSRPAGVGDSVRAADERLAIWFAARAESNIALDDWRERPSAERYAIYLAAEDRADAAQDSLATVTEQCIPASASPRSSRPHWSSPVLQSS